MGLQRCRKRKCILTNKESENEKVEQSSATKRRQADGALEILALPIFLIYEILSRLPIDTMLSCKCVCKTFLQVITDPCFIEKPHSTEHRMVVVDKFAPFNLFSFRMLDLEKPFPSLSCSPTQDKDQNNYESFYSWQTLHMPNSLANVPCYTTQFFGSCNGLLCIRYFKNDGDSVYYICNPILGEYMALSPPDTKCLHLVGFGFCLKTKQYKVIQFLQGSYCNILTLGQDYWRMIDNVPYPDPTLISIGPSFNGYLHWNTGILTNEKWIGSLNLETEELKFLPPPTHLNQDLREKMPKIRLSEMRLAVFDGMFCASYIVGGQQFEVCAMKDYGVKESWAKMVVINLDIHRNPVMPLMRLLNDGILLLGRGYDPLIYYNTRKGNKITIMTKGQYDALDYFPSLISLKNIAGEKNVEIARCKRHHNIFPTKGTSFILKFWENLSFEYELWNFKSKSKEDGNKKYETRPKKRVGGKKDKETRTTNQNTGV